MRWGLLAFGLTCMMMTASETEQVIKTELRTPEKVVSYVRTSEPMGAETIIDDTPNPVSDSDSTDADMDCQDIVAEKPTLVSLGQCRITFYCPCANCCGSWGNATASGVMPTANHTVATGSLPFGTKVIIDGAEYVVEDRGVGADEFDIFVQDHNEALARGLYYTEVFVIQ